MKAFYSDYVRHCMRYCMRYPQPATFRTDVDRYNWIACKTALEKYQGKEAEIIATIYKEKGAMADNICKLSEQYSISQDSLWGLISSFEKRVAKLRRLI